uniref:BED-type domain-containing protein n=1 Tax=Ditylenchus dipsaci TaxID=166011 RepID=A0A915DKT5_9BILA
MPVYFADSLSQEQKTPKKRSRDPIWDNFTEVDNLGKVKMKCNQCQQIVTKHKTSLTSHWECRHKDDQQLAKKIRASMAAGNTRNSVSLGNSSFHSGDVYQQLSPSSDASTLPSYVTGMMSGMMNAYLGVTLHYCDTSSTLRRRQLERSHTAMLIRPSFLWAFPKRGFQIGNRWRKQYGQRT